MYIKARAKYITITMILSILSMILGSVNAYSKEVFSFRNAILGMTYSEFENIKLPKSFEGRETIIKCRDYKSGNDAIKLCSLKKLSGGSSSFNVGGEKGEIIFYHFFKIQNENDFKLSNIRIKLNTSSFPRISDLLKTKYGVEAESSDNIVQNNMGATFTNRELIWDNQYSQIIVIERDDKIDKMSIEYRHTELFKMGMDSLDKKKDKDIDKI